MKRKSILTRSVCGFVALLLGAVAPNAIRAATVTWDNGSGNGLWDTESVNWSGSVWTNSITAPDSAVFGENGLGTVTLATNMDFNTITFEATGYTITGGNLSLAGSPSSITNDAGATNTIDSVLTDGPAGSSVLDIEGPGGLAFSGPSTYSGGTTVNGGTLTFGSDNSGSSFVGTGTLTINAGATVAVFDDNPFGYLGNIIKSVVINGGTLIGAPSTGGCWFDSCTMTGGTITGTGDSRLDMQSFTGYTSTFTINASTTSSVISIVNFNLATPTTFNVANGATVVMSSSIGFANGPGPFSTLTIAGSGIFTFNGIDIQPITVSGGTFNGTGMINAPVEIQSASTLGAGTSSALGTLTVSNTLTLDSASTTFLRISKTGGIATNDELAGLAEINYAGKLVVTNVTSDSAALAAGDTFVLFSAFSAGSSPYKGTFDNFILPTFPTGSGLSWDVSQLAVNGSIAVVSGAATPIFSLSSGTYFGAQSITISSFTPSATIYYTTNGTPPGTGSPSGTSPVTVTVPVNTTMTIEAFAQSSTYSASPTATATYKTVGQSSSQAVWINSAGGSWATPGNWTNNIIPSTGVTADFSQLTLSEDTYVTLDGSQTVGSMIFGDVGNVYNWELDTGSEGALLLSSANGQSTITVENQTTTITAQLSGTDRMIKAGNGTLALTTQNSYTGGTTVNAGTLVLPPAGSIGIISGPLTINSGAQVNADEGWALGYGGPGAGVTSITVNGGMLDITGNAGTGGMEASNITMTAGTISGLVFDWYAGITGNVTLATIGSSSSAVISSGFHLRLSGGNLTMNVAQGTTPNGVDLLISGPITLGNGNIVKTGAGSAVFSGANTISSTTTVSNGTLLVNGSLAASVTVDGGAVGGVGAINAPVTINSGGTMAPGGLSTNIGALTISSDLMLNSGSTMIARLNASNGANDSVGGINTLTYGGTLTVTNLSGTLAAGNTFQLLNAANYVGNFTATNLPPLASGLGWNWTPGTGVLTVVSTAPPPATITGCSVMNGKFNLTFRGNAGANYTIYATTNLGLPLSSWAVITSGVFTNGPMSYSDPTSVNYPARFYEVIP
jgi:autotransporter-associated beta strand protein